MAEVRDIAEVRSARPNKGVIIFPDLREWDLTSRLRTGPRDGVHRVPR